MDIIDKGEEAIKAFKEQLAYNEQRARRIQSDRIDCILELMQQMRDTYERDIEQINTRLYFIEDKCNIKPSTTVSEIHSVERLNEETLDEKIHKAVITAVEDAEFLIDSMDDEDNIIRLTLKALCKVINELDGELMVYDDILEGIKDLLSLGCESSTEDILEAIEELKNSADPKYI